MSNSKKLPKITTLSFCPTFSFRPPFKFVYFISNFSFILPLFLPFVPIFFPYCLFFWNASRNHLPHPSSGAQVGGIGNLYTQCTKESMHSWRLFLQQLITRRKSQRPLRLKKHEMIAQAFSKRRELQVGLKIYNLYLSFKFFFGKIWWKENKDDYRPYERMI